MIVGVACLSWCRSLFASFHPWVVLISFFVCWPVVCRPRFHMIVFPFSCLIHRDDHFSFLLSHLLTGHLFRLCLTVTFACIHFLSLFYPSLRVAFAIFLLTFKFAMPSTMPGFAFITGVFGCFNHRILDPVHKPKTVTFDAEIPIGENDDGQLQCIKGILHYFVPSHEHPPDDDSKYFVSGKVISISSIATDERALMDYDLQIEALTVC